MARSTPQVRHNVLRWRSTTNSAVQEIAVGSAEWCTWLDAHGAFRFNGMEGAFSARKEHHFNGLYWYAYRQEYHTEGPHNQLSYLTPSAFKAARTEAQATQTNPLIVT